MSTHAVNVIRISAINPHPDADSLELVPVWGYVCAIRKGSFAVGDLAAYVEPDYEVPLDRPEFSFLAKPGKERARHRIAVKKLRGVYSQGLLIAAPSGSSEGDNVIEALGITRYEPPEEVMVKGAFAEKGPSIIAPKYDIENWKKYRSILEDGEEVIITPKIHGCNGRFVWFEDRMWCGSRTQWKMRPGSMIFPAGDAEPIEVKQNAWWGALESNPWIESWCKEHPGVVLYGEVFGPQIQRGFHYGMANNQFGFVVFDVLRDNHWVVNAEFQANPDYEGLKFLPVLYAGPYVPDMVGTLAEENETYNGAGHIREGVVVKVVNERRNYDIGRVVLKYVSNRYLES